MVKKGSCGCCEQKVPESRGMYKRRSGHGASVSVLVVRLRARYRGVTPAGPHQNATTVQVAIGVVPACKWRIENPCRGVRMPDDLPHGYILEISKPYPGE